MRWPRLHLATIAGRLRSDAGLLVLIGLVVALTTALTAAVGPLTERTADRAVADSVRQAGLRGAVVATMPQGYDDPRGRTRDPLSVTKVRQDARYAQYELPARLDAVLRPGITTLATPPLHLLDAGPGRYLRLVYVDTPEGAPTVRYTAGAAPRASVGAGRGALTVPTDAGPWPVQVALSEAAAKALGVVPGDRLPAEDPQHRRFEVRISGVYAASDPDDEAWRTSSELLQPTEGVSEGVRFSSAAALVSPDSLPDLRVALPADDLTERVTFVPEPPRLRWSRSAAVQRAVVSLESSAGLARGDLSWDSSLDRVVGDGRAEVAAARGQAQVLVIGLLACALLVLVLAAQLLVHRRSGPVTLARERGGSLLGIGLELLVEALAVAVSGAALGLLVTWLAIGDVGWAAALPVLLVAASAAPVLGAAAAGRSTSARRVPANRTARRAATRARRLRRLALEVAVLAVAALSFVALRQRGVLGAGEDGGDLTAAGAATWWAVAGSLVVLRLLPPAVRLSLRSARGSTGGVRFLVAARLAQTGSRALPLLVVSVAVAQLTLGVALAATERHGQSAGALLAVGGDARLTTAPAAGVAATARAVAGEPGVRAAAAARVADGVQVASARSADTVRLVVVDAAAYQRLLAASPLGDAPQLTRLRTAGAGGVPALVSGGDAALREGLVVHWAETDVPLDVVGSAPDVEASGDPVVVVDARALAATGAVVQPDTVWAVGPGAASALRASAGPAGSVVTYADELDARRHAALPAGLVRLAVAASVVLLLLAVLGVVLAAATDAPARGASLGRLRSLGLPDGDLRSVLAGELLVPVVVAMLAGLLLGIGSAYAMFGSLSLELVTGQTGPPRLVVPWWTALAGAVLVAGVAAVTAVEWRRLRRRVLAQLLRS